MLKLSKNFFREMVNRLRFDDALFCHNLEAYMKSRMINEKKPSGNITGILLPTPKLSPEYARYKFSKIGNTKSDGILSGKLINSISAIRDSYRDTGSNSIGLTEKVLGRRYAIKALGNHSSGLTNIDLLKHLTF